MASKERNLSPGSWVAGAGEAPGEVIAPRGEGVG